MTLEKLIKKYQSCIDAFVNKRIEEEKKIVERWTKNSKGKKVNENFDTHNEKIKSLEEWRDTYFSCLTKRLLDFKKTVSFGEIWDLLNTNKNFKKDLLSVLNDLSKTESYHHIDVSESRLDLSLGVFSRSNIGTKVYIVSACLI